MMGARWLTPCEAHLAARRIYWADMMGDSSKVKRRVEYDDMSELHNGHTVKHCQCPGNRVPARGEIPGGFHPWGSDPLSELGYVCDDCGVMCECCANCQTVGDCECA